MKKHINPRVIITAVIGMIGSSQAAMLIPAYGDGTGEGFNDPTLGAQRRNAFEYALGLWSDVLGEAYSGETIEVDAVFDPLGGTPTSATLGFAGPLGSNFVTGNPLGPNVFYPGALRNHLSGSDVVTGSEITATFNSDVDGNVVLGTTTFYYGTDDNAPAGTTDFVSTAIHEIGHGLGWTGTLNLNSASGGFGDYLNGALINSFDFFVQRTSDGAPLSGLSTSDRLAATQGDDISWSGPLGIAANGGTEPDLFAPNPAQSGSSYAHLDEGDFPTELMSPQATPGTGHALSPLTLSILQDQGWTLTPIPEPSSALLAAIGLLLLGRRHR